MGKYVNKATMYCRECSYALDGAGALCCAKCGRSFDPSNPKTYRKVSRAQRQRTALYLLVLSIILALLGGLAYRRHRIQQQLGRLAAARGGLHIREPLGPAWYVNWVKRWNLPVPKRTVHFSSSVVTDADTRYLAKLHALRELTLVGCPLTNSGLAHLKGLTSIEKLNLLKTRISDEGLQYLRPLAKLQELHLGQTLITDTGLAHLGTFGELRFLGLDSTRVSNAGIEHLKGLAKLEFLDLGRTEVTDDGLAFVAKTFPNLRGLYLCGTEVTDTGIEHLKQLDYLVELDVEGTGVTEDGKAKLKQILPNRTFME
jgi:hypothetical protein